MDAPELEEERNKIAELQHSLANRRNELRDTLAGLSPLEEETRRVGDEIMKILDTGNLQFILPDAPTPPADSGATPRVRISGDAYKEVVDLLSEYYRAASISATLSEAVELLERASAEVLCDSESLLEDVRSAHETKGVVGPTRKFRP